MSCSTSVSQEGKLMLAIIYQLDPTQLLHRFIIVKQKQSGEELENMHT